MLQTLLRSAAQLCSADKGGVWQRDGELLRLTASFDMTSEAHKYFVEHPMKLGRGSAAGRAALERKAVHIPDVLADPEYVVTDLSEAAGYRSALAIPLLRDGTMIGCFTVVRTEINPFTEKQIELVTTFADQAVIAIENARLLDELRQSLERQTATSEVLQVISSSQGDLGPVFRAMLENAARICETPYGILYLYDGQYFSLATHVGAGSTVVELMTRGPISPHPDTILGRIAASKSVVEIEDARKDRGYIARHPVWVAAVEQAGAIGLLGVPMLKGNLLVGAFVIFRQEVQPFTDKQIELVKNFASQAIIAIENARLLNELRARTDELARSVEELRTLGETSQTVNSTLDLETVLNTIVTKAVQLSSTEAGAIYVFDTLQREFDLSATYGMDRELISALKEHHIRLDEPIVAQVLAQPEPMQVADLREGEPSAVNEIIFRAGFHALWLRRCGVRTGHRGDAGSPSSCSWCIPEIPST